MDFGRHFPGIVASTMINSISFESNDFALVQSWLGGQVEYFIDNAMETGDKCPCPSKNNFDTELGLP